MLKFDLLLLLLLTLQLDGDWSKIISCVLGFFAGMCLFVSGELKNNTLTPRSVLIRVLSAFGVSFLGVMGKDYAFPTWNTAIVVALCTFFSESIIAIGTVGFIKYIKNISGVRNEHKDDANA